MPDYTKHQKKIISRYYDHRDNIMLTKLQELLTELYLAETEKQRESLWKRVGQAMTNLKVPPPIAAHILQSRDIQILARNVEDWLKKSDGR